MDILYRIKFSFNGNHLLRKFNYIDKGGGSLAGYKVEICGVNTAELPLLKSKGKRGTFKENQTG